MLTNFERTLEYKSLLCDHLEQEVIKSHYVTSSMIYDSVQVGPFLQKRLLETRLRVKYHFRVYGHTHTSRYKQSSPR